MAKYFEPTQEEVDGWRVFKESLPEKIRIVADKFEPWRLYKMSSTGHRCYVHSIGEDGTMMMTVSDKYNLVMYPRIVFGIPAEELTECDLPDPGERVGSILRTEAEIDAFVKEQKKNCVCGDPRCGSNIKNLEN